MKQPKQPGLCYQNKSGTMFFKIIQFGYFKKKIKKKNWAIPENIEQPEKDN